MITEILISTDYIKLQQALKLAGFVGNGSDVKFLLEEQRILVNGEIAHERGKKLRPGDVFTLDGEACTVAAGG